MGCKDHVFKFTKEISKVLLLEHTRCVRKVMTLNAWLDNWQSCSHISDTSRDIHSYLMISASFNSIALTCLI